MGPQTRFKLFAGLLLILDPKDSVNRLVSLKSEQTLGLVTAEEDFLICFVSLEQSEQAEFLYSFIN